MKTKSFDDYLKKRLNTKEIKEIERQAKREYKTFRSLQEDVSRAVTSYMVDEKIGFNELARRLDVSPSQVSRIKKGKANLTLASLAHIFSLLKRRPHLVFE